MEEDKILNGSLDNEVDIDPNTVTATEEDKQLKANDAGDLVPVYEEKLDENGIPLIIDPHKRNPTGRNGMKDKQELMWTIYLRLWREGRPSIKAAGMAAGFTPNTAKNLGAMGWFKERKAKLKRKAMFTRAEHNIAKILAEEYATMQLQDDGSQKRIVDKDVMKVVADVSKTVVTHLGKDEGWSTKTEVQGNMGGNINIKSISYADPVKVDNQIVDAVADKTEEVVRDVVMEAVKPNEEGEKVD